SGLLPSLSEYARVWGLTPARVALMKPEAVVLHPGPMNRGVEISPDVADGERSRILAQVENGVAVRSAVLSRLARAALERRASLVGPGASPTRPRHSTPVPPPSR